MHRPMVANSFRPAVTTETKGSACPVPAASGGRTREGLTRQANHTKTAGATIRAPGSRTSNHQDGSADDISFGNARENPRFDMGSRADKK